MRSDFHLLSKSRRTLGRRGGEPVGRGHGIYCGDPACSPCERCLSKWHSIVLDIDDWSDDGEDEG